MVGYPTVPQSILHYASKSCGYVSVTFPLKCKLQALKRYLYLLISVVFQYQDDELRIIFRIAESTGDQYKGPITSIFSKSEPEHRTQR